MKKFTTLGVFAVAGSLLVLTPSVYAQAGQGHAQTTQIGNTAAHGQLSQTDQAYAKDMVKDHTKDVSEFQKAVKNLQNSALRAWAQKTLPVLEQHLQLAKTMEASIGK